MTQPQINNVLFDNTAHASIQVQPYPVYWNATTGALFHFANGFNAVPIYQAAASSSTTVSMTSGTAVQNPFSQTSTFYLNVNGATGGTVTVAIGPTTSNLTTVVPSQASNAATSHLIPVPVPANWYIKVTTTTATLYATTTVVSLPY